MDSILDATLFTLKFQAPPPSCCPVHTFGFRTPSVGAYRIIRVLQVVSLLLFQEQDWYPSTHLEAYSLLHVCHSRQEYKQQNPAFSGATQCGISRHTVAVQEML